MQPYANLSGESGIISFESGPDYITIQFEKGEYTFYKYTYSSAGRDVIENMKNLALSGSGLNSYVSSNKPPYDSKW